MAKIVFNTMSEAKDYLGSDFNEFLNSPYCITEGGIRDELEEIYPTRSGDDEMNETAYEGLSNLDVNDYIDGITNNDLLLDEYENWLSDYNTEDELDISNDCVSEMAGELTSETDIEENFDNALNSYVSYCERHYSGFGEEDDDINIDLEYNEEDNSVDEWSDLAEVDDKIGEQTNVKDEVILDYDKAGFVECEKLIYNLNLKINQDIFFVNCKEVYDNKDRDIYKYAEFVESLISEEDKSKFTISYLDNKTMAAKEFYDKVKSKSVHLGDKTVNNFKRLFQCMEVI